jgi:short subunit dehydrogenase-like uncharacterized protein
MDFLIYGATGYTGEVIARLASSRGQRPILAGRSAGAVATLAGDLRLPHRVFGLDDPRALDAGLDGMGVVLHCAGPFSRTARPMVEACLRKKIHYLDITGEIAVFEALARRDAAAGTAGITLLPGVGFDVVPSDCLAAHVKRRLPTATRLALAFAPSGAPSRGTATTALESLHQGGVVRRGGVLTPVPAAWRTRAIDFGRGPRKAITIPWGDVATAYRSTGIPDIEVYMAAPTSLRVGLRLARPLLGLAAWKPVRSFLQRRIRSGPPGPTAEQRSRARSYLWAEAADDAGRRAVSRLATPDAYALTALTALAALERVRKGEAPPGYQTPATAFGPDFVLEIEGCSRTDEPAIGPAPQDVRGSPPA